MPIILTTGPSIEPVTLNEAKEFLRVDSNDEDNLISSLITAGRIHIEQAVSRKLITQQWTWYLSEWPDEQVLDLPINPVQSVQQIQTYDTQGIPTIWDSENYAVDVYSEPARLIRKAPWPVPQSPVNGIEIQITAGYGNNTTNIPEPIRQALRLLVSHWFENREPVVLGDTAVYIPETALGLLAPYQTARL